MSRSNQIHHRASSARGAVAPDPWGARLLAGPLGTRLALALVLVLLALHQVVSYGSDHALGGVVRNALHIPLFAALTLLLARVLGSPRWWALLAAALGLAIVTEVIQAFTGRNASAWDVAVDLIGIVPVVAGLEVTRRWRRRRNAPVLIGTLWLAIFTLLTAVTLAAPVYLLLNRG